MAQSPHSMVPINPNTVYPMNSPFGYPAPYGTLYGQPAMYNQPCPMNYMPTNAPFPSTSNFQPGQIKVEPKFEPTSDFSATEPIVISDDEDEDEFTPKTCSTKNADTINGVDE